jgi:hypothetical protein
MLNLDYELSAEWNAKARNVDWARADEATLRYQALMGNQIFLIGEADFSARWGWVPLLDFAASLVKIAQNLIAGKVESVFEFTESDAQLRFSLRGNNTLITSSYSNARAVVPLAELEKAASLYAERVLRDAIKLYPALERNPSLRTWYPSIIHAASPNNAAEK